MSYPNAPGPYGGPGPYGPYGPVHTQIVTQPHRSSTAHVVIAWILTVLTLGYTLPWAIAATRNKTNTATIALVNVFLGWSLVGWVVALVLSLLSDPQPTIYVHTAVLPQPPYPLGPASVQAPVLPPAMPRPPYGAPQPGYQPQPEPTVILPPDAPDPWRRPEDQTYR